MTYNHRSQPEGSRNQATALRAEGVTVTENAMGELLVDFGEFGWFPRVLPSEAAEGVEEPEGNDEGSDEDEEES
jgi:methylated-DNA-protein-cysteine methyltransferase related protein